MKRLLLWLGHWRRYQRDRRVARLGGCPYRDDPSSVERFAPGLNRVERVSLIEEYAARLSPDGVDEATGDPLDNLINALADEWTSEMGREFVAFRSEASIRLGEATAVVKQYEVLNSYDWHQLRQMELALESAVYRLGGRDPLDLR